MLKFVVALYRKPDLSPDEFHANLRNEHGALAERIPGCDYVPVGTLEEAGQLFSEFTPV